MAIISHYLLEFKLILEYRLSDHETHANCNFSIYRVYLNQDIVGWSLVISESKTRQLYFLIVPFSPHDDLIIGQATWNYYLVRFKVSLDFTNGGVKLVKFFTIKNTMKRLIFFIDLGRVVVIIQSEFFPFEKILESFILFFLLNLLTVYHIEPIHSFIIWIYNNIIAQIRKAYLILIQN